MTIQEKIQQEKEKLLAEDVSAFPSLFQQARNLAKQAWLSGSGAIKGERFLATAERAAARLAICASCEFYQEPRCTKCGCFMDKKAQLELAGCPENKWGNLTTIITPKNAYSTPLLVKEKKEIDSKMDIHINTFRPELRDQIKEQAIVALKYDGRFNFNKIPYLAIQRDDGEIFLRQLAPAIPASPKKTYTEEERKELQNLVQINKTTDAKTFEFKGDVFKISFDNLGRVIVTSKPIGRVDPPPDQIGP